MLAAISTSESASSTGALPTGRLPRGALPTDCLSTSALESELVGLAGHLTAAHCRWLQLLAAFDDREGWAGPGLRTCAHWLSWRVGMNLRTAFEQLRVAHALAALPVTTTAFAAGRISYSKVRAITRVATPETEQALVDLALAGTASHVERVVRGARQARADPAETHAGRHLHWTWGEDGMLDLRGRLTPEQGAVLLSALATATEDASPGQHQRSAEHRTPSRHRMSPVAGSEAESGGGDAPPGVALEPLAARRTDALVALVTGSGSSDKALSAAAQVVLHIDAESATAHIERGPETRHLDAHHIKHWLHGGRTDIHNLVLLCDRHHRLIHDHGYSMRGIGNDVTFHRPDGRPIDDAGPPTGGRLEAVYELSSAHGIAITDETLTPTWAGERLDPTPILALLLPEPSMATAA